MNLLRSLLIWSFAILLFSCGDSSTTEGDRLFRLKKYQAAIVEYDSFLALKPENVKTLYNRGRSYEELGQYEKAMADYKKVLEIDPENANANLSIGKNFYRKKDFDNTVFFIEKAIKVDDKNADAFTLLGRAQHKLGKLKDARIAYDNAIRVNDQFGEAYLYRGTLNAAAKQRTKACADFQTAASLNVAKASELLKKYCK